MFANDTIAKKTKGGRSSTDGPLSYLRLGAYSVLMIAEKSSPPFPAWSNAS